MISRRFHFALTFALTLGLGLGLSACSVDKAPSQPPRRAPAAPAPDAAPPAREEDVRQMQERAAAAETLGDKPQLLSQAAGFALLLKARASQLQKPAGPLPINSESNWTAIQRKLLHLAESAKWQSEQDVYLDLLKNDLLLYVRDENGQGIYHWLAQADQTHIAKKLIRAHFVYNLQLIDREKRQPLHFAHSRAMAKLLVDAGNDPQLTDKDGLNPFEAMLERGETAPLAPTAAGLCEAGHGLRHLFYESPVNLPASDGLTFLQRAATEGNLEAISSLLACPEVNVAVTGQEGRTALHAAACAGRDSYAATYALLAHFNSRAHLNISLADFLSARDDAGETAESLAGKCENADTARLLHFFKANLD